MIRLQFASVTLAAWMGLSAGCALAQSPARDFAPDVVVSSDRLNSFRQFGDAIWVAREGNIVAQPRTSGAGGFLLLDTPLQDVVAFAEFYCTEACQVGLIARAETTPDRIQGYLASFGDRPADPAFVTFTADGVEAERTKLANPTGQARFATPPNGVIAGDSPTVPGVVDFRTFKGERPRAPVIPIGGDVRSAATPQGSAPALAVAAPAGATAPARPNPIAATAGVWHRMDLLIDTNMLRARLNGGRGGVGGVTLDDAQGFGVIGLYVGPGSGEVRFRNIAYKDLGRQTVETERVSRNYRMQKLDDFSYAWDTAVADINRDGHTDVVAGPYYYLGPTFENRREIYVAATYAPGTQYAPNMITYTHDFDSDGWPDVLATEGRQMVLYVNPRGEPRRWARYLVVPGNSSELTLLEDLDVDGMPEVLLVQGGRVAFATVDPASPMTPWPVFFVSEMGQGTLHSFGVGDINGDGRKDIVQVKGWWEQPAGGVTAAAWTFHPYTFNSPDYPAEAPEGGGDMAVVDVNGDGLADVISSINAHGWGLAWYEQTRANGSISFISHLIMGDHTRKNPGGLTVSQLHAGAVAADVNHDGVVDFFTGKKQWSHLDSNLDPDPAGPPYLLLYRGVRDRSSPGGVRFDPEVIHNRSGVGSSLTVTDLDRDGTHDVVTSGVRGTFVFWGKAPPP
jgi:hypothetical protein